MGSKVHSAKSAARLLSAYMANGKVVVLNARALVSAYITSGKNYVVRVEENHILKGVVSNVNTRKSIAKETCVAIVLLYQAPMQECVRQKWQAC